MFGSSKAKSFALDMCTVVAVEGVPVGSGVGLTSVDVIERAVRGTVLVDLLVFSFLLGSDA